MASKLRSIVLNPNITAVPNGGGDETEWSLDFHYSNLCGSIPLPPDILHIWYRRKEGELVLTLNIDGKDAWLFIPTTMRRALQLATVCECHLVVEPSPRDRYLYD